MFKPLFQTETGSFRHFDRRVSVCQAARNDIYSSLCWSDDELLVRKPKCQVIEDKMTNALNNLSLSQTNHVESWNEWWEFVIKKKAVGSSNQPWLEIFIVLPGNRATTARVTTIRRPIFTCPTKSRNLWSNARRMTISNWLKSLSILQGMNKSREVDAWIFFSKSYLIYSGWTAMRACKWFFGNRART